MSRIVYTPEGAESQEWPFHWSKLLSTEAIAMEDATGMDYVTDIVPALGRGNMRAMQALLWVHLRRGQPDLKLESVQFCLDELDILEDAAPAETPAGKDEPSKAKTPKGPRAA